MGEERKRKRRREREGYEARREGGGFE